MKKILLLLFILNANNLFAQVYNYDPIRHSGFETNPSYLASDKTEFSAMIKHTGSYQTGKFYSDEINISKYNQNRFVGLGLVVNNSRINDSARYQYAGIGSAYRIILFNKIYTRIGFLAKIINVRSPLGLFNYYSFSKREESAYKSRVAGNLNFSASFSSGNDRYFISFGVLNAAVPFVSESINFFPKYYFINVGDFGKLFGRSPLEISYSIYSKKFEHEKFQGRSHHIIILYDGYKITRHSGIKYGSRIGYVDQKYIQLSPSLAYYHRTSNKRNLIYRLLFDTGIRTAKNISSYKSNIQLTINYLF